MVTIAGNVMLPKREKRLFLCLFASIVIASLCEWSAATLDGTSAQAAIPITLFKAVEFSLAPSLAVLYASVLGPEDNRVKVAMGFVALHAAIEWLLAPTGLVFYVDDAGSYHHGPAYAVYLAAYIASAIFLIAMTRRFSESFQYRNRRLPWLVIAFVALCTTIQSLETDVYIVWLALEIGASMLYIFYCSVIQQTDALTRLLNRYSFESTLSRLNKKSIILVFDVDDFKHVNDTRGHASGDSCLRLVGRAIYDSFSMHGSCYRIGGDEFSVILPDDHSRATELEISFEQKIEALRAVDATFPTVSIGEADLDPECDDLVNAYNAADELMYSRKRERKQAERGGGRDVHTI